MALQPFLTNCQVVDFIKIFDLVNLKITKYYLFNLNICLKSSSKYYIIFLELGL